MVAPNFTSIGGFEMFEFGKENLRSIFPCTLWVLRFSGIAVFLRVLAHAFV